jgi:4-hydroxybenzoate polyprenyltransferase
MTSAKDTARAWIEALRAPNLLTVPGDPLAGFLLASLGAPAPAILPAAAAVAAALALYAAGVLGNAWADAAEDARDRPARPIPSGRLTPRAVARAAWILTGLGVGLSAAAGSAAAAAGGLLAALVWTYTLGRRIGLRHPLVMGACRGASVLLGAAAAGQPCAALPLAAAAATALYVTALAWVARDETLARRARDLASLPPLGLLPYLALWLHRSAYGAGAALWLPALAAVATVLATSLRAGRPAGAPSDVPAAIGAWIRALLPLQASLCLAAGSAGAPAAIALLLLWPLCHLAARRVAQS